MLVIVVVSKKHVSVITFSWMSSATISACLATSSASRSGVLPPKYLYGLTREAPKIGLRETAAKLASSPGGPRTWVGWLRYRALLPQLVSRRTKSAGTVEWSSGTWRWETARVGTRGQRQTDVRWHSAALRYVARTQDAARTMASCPRECSPTWRCNAGCRESDSCDIWSESASACRLLAAKQKQPTPSRTAAGIFIMLARQSGTRCQMNLEILTASIVLNGFWKHSSLTATSATSALEVIFNEMRNINLRFTYLLTSLTELWNF